ncbi:hypothetical protein FHY33_000041 [Xanthomonas arboricola]|nr:hypothetical protein [Xanthomonas campestris]
MGCTSADAGLSLPSTFDNEVHERCRCNYLVSRFRWHATQDRAWRTPASPRHSANRTARSTLFFLFPVAIAGQCNSLSRRINSNYRLPGLKDTCVRADKLPYTGLCVRDPRRRFDPHRRPADPE